MASQERVDIAERGLFFRRCDSLRQALLPAALLARPQPHRARLRQAEGLPAKGCRASRRYPVGSYRRHPQRLHSTGLRRLLPPRCIRRYLTDNCSRLADSMQLHWVSSVVREMASPRDAAPCLKKLVLSAFSRGCLFQPHVQPHEKGLRVPPERPSPAEAMSESRAGSQYVAATDCVRAAALVNSRKQVSNSVTDSGGCRHWRATRPGTR